MTEAEIIKKLQSKKPWIVASKNNPDYQLLESMYNRGKLRRTGPAGLDKLTYCYELKTKH